MTDSPKIQLIREAIAKADRYESKLTEGPLSIGGYTGKRIRHLLNNLGAISTNYLEIGCHRGSTFISTLYKNDHLHNDHVAPVAVDNFNLFNEGSDQLIYEDFGNNCDKYGVHDSVLMKQDCWTIEPDFHAMQPFDLYLYDGPHSLEEQARAITHFLPSLADECIICIDDAHWPDVMNGTNLGLQQAGIVPLFDQLLYSGQESDGDGYWNGFRVLVINK